jgi:hypothetical protein
METSRERALSFLHAERESLASLFPSGSQSEAWPERDGRIAGAVGALRAVGLLAPEEAELWRARLASPPDEQGVAGDGARSEAAELLTELLEVVPPAKAAPGRAERLTRFQAALAALRAIGAAGTEWEERLSERMGRQSPETVGKLNAGGTEQELVAVCLGPPEVGGKRVLYALRFADGISFAIRSARSPDGRRRGKYPWEYSLRDDVGTTYAPGGGGGCELDRHISFRTAPPPAASWVELVGDADTPIRLAL